MKKLYVGKKLYMLLLCFIGVLCLNSCQKQPEELTVGEEDETKIMDKNYIEEGWNYLEDLDSGEIMSWVQEKLDSEYDALFSEYNGSAFQRITPANELSYSPATCPDIIFYKATEEDVHVIAKKMIDEMINPLTNDSSVQSYKIISYSVEDQELIPLKENVWIIPMLNVYYKYTGTDLVTMETYIEHESELLKDDMMPLMRQGSDDAFVYILIEKDGIYRLQRALDMCKR